MTKKNDFSQGSISKAILKLALPMTFAQLINILYNIVDRMYIGRIPGASSLALTGVGITFPLITIIMAFANLFGMGGAPLCSIERGKDNKAAAEEIMGNSFILLIFTGIMLIIFGLLFKRPLLLLLGASNKTIGYADEYLTIYLLGSLFVMISLGMNSFINCQGFGRVGMMTILLGAVTNIILDPIFIFIFHLGVKGAALATVISQFLSAFWVMKFLTGKNTLLKLKMKYFKINFFYLKKIISLGLSSFIMAATTSIVQIVCNISLQSDGGDLYVGIMTVLNSIREIVTMPVHGLTNGSQPILGFNYGAKKYERVKSAIKFTSISCIIYTVIIWLIISLFPAFFIKIFNSQTDLIKYGVPAMHIYFFGFFMMSLQFAGQATYVALGKSKMAIFFSLLRKIIIVVPLTIILPKTFGLGVKGVFLAEPISNFIGGLACYLTMLVKVWPELSIKATETLKYR